MKSGFETLGRMRLQAVLLLGSVFVIGILCGVAFDRTFLERGHPPRRPGGPSPEGLPPELTRELRLSADQEERIRTIFQQYRPRTEAILDGFFPRLRAVTDSARAEIRAILTPEQQQVFDREQPPEFGKGGRPLFPGGPPHGRPPFGERPPGPPGGAPPGCSDTEGGFGAPAGPPPAGPSPADQDTTRERPPHEPSPR